MRHENRRTYLVEQRHKGVSVQLHDIGRRRHSCHLRREELIEHRIAGRAPSWPLAMKMRLRPLVIALGRRKARLGTLGRIGRCRHWAIHIQCVRGSASAHLVHYIYGVALS